MEILSIIVLVIFLFVFDSISTIPLLCRELQSKILWRMALSLSNKVFKQWKVKQKVGGWKQDRSQSISVLLCTEGTVQHSLHYLDARSSCKSPAQWPQFPLLISTTLLLTSVLSYHTPVSQLFHQLCNQFPLLTSIYLKTQNSCFSPHWTMTSIVKLQNLDHPMRNKKGLIQRAICLICAQKKPLRQQLGINLKKEDQSESKCYIRDRG